MQYHDGANHGDKEDADRHDGSEYDVNDFGNVLEMFDVACEFPRGGVFVAEFDSHYLYFLSLSWWLGALLTPNLVAMTLNFVVGAFPFDDVAGLRLPVPQPCGFGDGGLGGLPRAVPRAILRGPALAAPAVAPMGTAGDEVIQRFVGDNLGRVNILFSNAVNVSDGADDFSTHFPSSFIRLDGLGLLPQPLGL